MTSRIVVLAAGLRQPSSTRLLADRLSTATAAALGQRGQTVEVETVELRHHSYGAADSPQSPCRDRDPPLSLPESSPSGVTSRRIP